jgi:transposase InsO family protein
MNPYTLLDRSKRPKNMRKSKKYIEYGSKIRKIREDNPTWSKYKIGAYLRQKGANISDSSVGYILTKKNLIDIKVSKKRKRAKRRNRNKIRVNNTEIRINKPGALVQMDTKEYYSPGEGKYIQFTAVDCFSRKRKLNGYSRKTAVCAKSFLKKVITSFPFAIDTIVTDNGSEFMADFDKECIELGIKHLWTAPSSPNQNAYVESSHCIDQKEFYEVQFIGSGVKGFNDVILPQ